MQAVMQGTFKDMNAMHQEFMTRFINHEEMSDETQEALALFESRLIDEASE